MRTSSSEASSSQESEWPGQPRLCAGTCSSTRTDTRVQHCLSINQIATSSVPFRSNRTCWNDNHKTLPCFYHQTVSFLKHALKCGNPGEGKPTRRYLPNFHHDHRHHQRHPRYHLISQTTYHHATLLPSPSELREGLGTTLSTSYCSTSDSFELGLGAVLR